jgi:sulfate adenylyltransferase subunit 1
MATLETPVFSIDKFFVQEREKDLLRFSTAGSVDDGKSTLIGRLLYDTQSVYDDQIRSIRGKGTTAPGQIDFALLTDGLRAEREQGITIDVAYRYFSTARRKFIIADTPGHEQYTRNMATGASTADAAVVLIDASKGVLLQSRRHAYIASLLGVRHILVAVNKMDLIGYDEAPFQTIERDFRLLLQQIATDTGNPVECHFVPVSALAGDNIVHRSNSMPWYRGLSLLEFLESLPSSRDVRSAPFRFPVQRVLRPDHTFRGFSGQIASGTIRSGDLITALPSGNTAKVERIVTWDGDLAEASAPMSVTLVLDRELDISRGDLIAAKDALPRKAKRIESALVWMDQRSLTPDRRYILKHASHTVPAFISSVKHRTNIATLDHEPAQTLAMNDIGVVQINLVREIVFDTYAQNRFTGGFILIDPESNHTVAAGMISEGAEAPDAIDLHKSQASGPVTADERQARWGHRGAVLELTGPAALIDAAERSLFLKGIVSCRLDTSAQDFKRHPELLEHLAHQLVKSGLLVLLAHIDADADPVARIEGDEIRIDSENLGDAVSAIHSQLQRAGVFAPIERTGQ